MTSPFWDSSIHLTEVSTPSTRDKGRAHLGDGGVAVIAEFDGMHLGHIRLVDAALEVAARRGASCSALVICSSKDWHQLMPIAERCYQLVRRGLHRAMAIESFTNDAADITERIVDTVARDRIDVVVLACRGADNVGFPSLCRALGRVDIEVVEVPTVSDGDARVISTDLVRERIVAGDVEVAGRLLGKPHRLRGTVEHGDHRGRTIGFPTANLRPSTRDVVPAEGVYAAWVSVGHVQWRAAVNVGRRPTFYSESDVLIEAHLIGFAGDLYATQLSISFEHRLRSERRFEGIDDLVAQLRRDVDDAVRCLGEPPRGHDESRETTTLANVAETRRGPDER